MSEQHRAELLSRAEAAEATHQKRLTVLRQQQLEIADAVVALKKLYCEYFVVVPSAINHGLCNDFAEDLCTLVPGAEARWGDELLEEYDDEAAADYYGYHCIVQYDGKFYDSEHPFGVDDFRTMSTFER